MPRDPRRYALLATLALALTASATTADAGVVVVLSVRGDTSGDLERMLDDAVADAHELRNDDDYQKVARREGLGSEDARDIADVARILGADIVLDPSLRKQSGGYVLRVKLRDRTGKVAKTMVVKMKKARLGAAGKRDVAKELAETIAAILDERGGRDDGGDRDRRRRDDDEARDDVDGRGSARRRNLDRRDDVDDRDRRDDVDDRDRRDDEEDRDDRDRRDDEEDRDDRGHRRRRHAVASPREIRRAGIVVETGVIALKRTLSFSSRADFELPPQGYKGTFAPAGHVAVELYPAAITAPHSVVGGLGVYAAYDQVFGLVTRSTNAPDVDLTTQQVHWSVGARFRYAFGDLPNLPSVVIGVGYSRRAFTIDRSALPDGQLLDLPDVDYRAIEPSLQLRVPIGTERLALTLAAQALLMRTTGAIQQPEEYGAAKVTGVEGSVTIDAAITRRILLRLSGGMSQVGFDFNGNGRMSNMRDADPNQDVGGALDRWLGTSASLAVNY